MSALDDLRTALRSLARRPGFAAVVVLILAVALGANTAVFSVLQQTLLWPLPYPGAEGAVYVFRESPQGGFQVAPMLEQLRAWRERSESFTAMEGFDPTRVTLLGRGEPRRLEAAWVTPGLFDFLGVSPALGAGLGAPSPAGGDAGAGAERRVILSHGLWRELFGADPGALGETLRLGEEVYTVAGIMERGFRFVPPADAELWLPIPEEPDGPMAPITLARLAPGVSREAAEQELLALERHLAAERASDGGRGSPDTVWRPRIQGLGYLFGEDLGRAVGLLQAAVGLMLLIACANVGNLFLIRAEGRSREIAVRSALGASRWRVVRALLFESLLLGGAGALLAVVLARWGGGLVAALVVHRGTDLEALRLDPGLFAFSAASALLAVLAFGLVPALAASRTDLRSALQAGGPGATGASGSGGRVRAALVVAEVALALVLLAGAGLLTRSFVGLLATDPGFEPEGLLTVSINLPQSRYGEGERQRVFVRELRAALEAGGLEGAALATSAPPEGTLFFGRGLRVEGRPDLPEGVVDMVGFLAADPAYFRTLGIPIVEGRAPKRPDPAAETAEREIVVNRALARALWPEGEALGGRLRLGTSDDETWARVVGIVGPVAQLGLGSTRDTFQMYFPLLQARSVAILVRAGGDDGAESMAPRLVGERIAAAVHGIDPSLPVGEVERVEDRLGGSIGRQRFQTALMLTFAGIALVLAVVGVYSVLAYAVRRRSFEIGVRSALGASPGRVLGLIAGHGAVLVGIGLAAGLAASLALGRLVESQLHGVVADDPAVLAGAAGVLAAATALATLLPALRAARLDPARVLWQE